MQKIKAGWIISVLALIVLTILMVPVNFTGDTSDAIHHYLFAKNGFKHPENFLDLWAKPLFTLFAAPFAQFGFPGMHFFNILCAVFSSLLCISIAGKFNLKFTWLCPVLLILMPVYFLQICTAMTECFFGFVLILSFYFFTKKQFAAAAIVASFLAFARQEGYLLIPVIAVVFVMMRLYKYVPLLFTGILVFSLIGYFYFHDFLWLAHSNPYDAKGSLYGKGPLLHFVSKTELMFGFPIQIAIATGIIFALSAFISILIQKEKRKIIYSDHFFVTEYFLVFGFAVVFFAAHSVMWWKGVMSSAGLERVMACVAPLFCLMALRGINALTGLIQKFKPGSQLTKIITAVFVGIFTVALIAVFYFRNLFPPRIGEEEKVITTASDWVKAEKLDKRKIFFGHPYVIVLFNLNPKEKIDSDELGYTGGLQNIPSGGIIIWDAHFGPNENGFPLEALQKDSTLKFLKQFKPQYPFTVGQQNMEFEIDVFEKINP